MMLRIVCVAAVGVIACSHARAAEKTMPINFIGEWCYSSQENKKSGRSEPETAKIPLRDMPMRQGEIGGSRPADSDRLLLLRELPRSRKSLRATAFRPTSPQYNTWQRSSTP